MEVENERRSGRFCLHSPPLEIINRLAYEKIRLQRECLFIRQLFQDPSYAIIGLPACQGNFGQIKIFLISPKEVLADERMQEGEDWGLGRKLLGDPRILL